MNGADCEGLPEQAVPEGHSPPDLNGVQPGKSGCPFWLIADVHAYQPEITSKAETSKGWLWQVEGSLREPSTPDQLVFRCSRQRLNRNPPQAAGPHDLAIDELSQRQNAREGPARRSRTTERSELVSEEAEYHRPGIGILDAQ